MLGKKNFILKISILLALLAFFSVKSLIMLHEYSHGNNTIIVDKNDNSDDASDCHLCELAHISLKLLVSSAVSILVLSTYFLQILSRLSKVKLAYFLSSNLSRGPPAAI